MQENSDITRLSACKDPANINCTSMHLVHEYEIAMDFIYCIPYGCEVVVKERKGGAGNGDQCIIKNNQGI